MKRALLMAVVLLAGAAAAQEFRSRAPITLQGKDPFQRVELPFEVYRDARRDLGDVRVLNARGEAVPLALAGEAEPERAAPVSTALPQFPVNARTAPTTSSGGRIEVQVRARGDGTLVSVQERPSGKVPGAPRPAEIGRAHV